MIVAVKSIRMGLMLSRIRAAGKQEPVEAGGVEVLRGFDNR